MSTSDGIDVPTYSIEDERAVIGALLQNNRLMDDLAGLVTGSDFYGQRGEKAFEAIASIVARGGVADKLTVRAALASGDADANTETLDYLDGLTRERHGPASARASAAAVARYAARRTLIAAADQAVETACTEPDFAVAVDAITSSFGAVARNRVASAPRTIAEIALERLEHYTALEEGSIAAGWRTGIPWLDASLNGGLRPGSLYILAARPSVGKSSLAQALGFSTATYALPTLFLSMEMADVEVADRGVSSTGRISYSALLTGKMDSEHWNRAAEAMDQLGKLPFYIDDQPGLTLGQIRAKAKSVKGLKVLIVDYLQLCASSRRDGNRNSEIEEISRGLKGLAKELGIAVVALSQLNRDVEKRAIKRPTLSDLRDSGAIEQDADVVMFLWLVRDLTETEGRKILGLGIDKNRQGRLGEIGLDFYGDNQRWQQSAADIKPTAPGRSGKDDL